MSKEQKKIINFKNIIMKKKWITILSFLILLAIVGASIYFLHKPDRVQIVTREKSNIEATTDIQNIEIINVSSKENGQTSTLYILLKNTANSEQFLGNIQIELKDENYATKGIINGYVPEIGANSNYEVNTVTNIDLTGVTNVHIVKKD